MLDFLTLKPEVFGIDISDLSLKIIKLKKKRGFLTLASFGEADIQPGVIEAGEIKDEAALSEAIRKAVSQAKGERLKTKYVVASLPEQRAFLQVIQMPVMKKEEMEKAVYFEAENYIPTTTDKVYLDSQIVKSAAEHPDHLDVLIAALPQKTVDSYSNSFKKAGLKPLVFEIESQAVARSLIKREASSEPILLIDFGANRTSFIIFSGYSLRFTVSLPISSQKFTESIASHFKINLKEAEELKKKHGIEGGKKGKEILGAMERDLTNLTDQIKKYLSYYQTHSSHEHLYSNDKAVEKVILCGGAANMKGIDNFLSHELGIQVVLGNPWVNILPEPLKEVPELPYEESLKYTTALGLALKGINL